MIGISAYGAYVPRLRLERAVIAKNMAWYNPAIIAVARGEKAVANWDEDALTMAVAAGRDCLTGIDPASVDACYLAGTSLPFADRLNADILATALNVREEDMFCADYTGSTKAGTTALLSAFDALSTGRRSSVLVAAADLRKTKMATSHEMFLGDGAAALLAGTENLLAVFDDSYSVNCDFIDHYRGAGKEIDYTWEERWVRDEGFGKIIPRAVKGFCEKTGAGPGDYAKVIYPCYFSATHRGIAKKLGLAPEQVQDNFHASCGDTGTPHPLLMFVAALEQAKPGDKLLLVSFGQGCDVLSFTVTERAASFNGRAGAAGNLEKKSAMCNYQKFVKFRDLIEADMGIRGEANPNTSLTTLWRNRHQLLGLMGKRCTACGTPQYTFSPVCVNPACNAVDQLEDYAFAGREGEVLMYTGDMLAPSMDPPAIYGIVSFDGGGRMLFDFTDCALDDVQVGTRVNMSFRRRFKDEQRGMSGYFWKAVPVQEEGV